MYPHLRQVSPYKDFKVAYIPTLPNMNVTQVGNMKNRRISLKNAQVIITDEFWSKRKGSEEFRLAQSVI